ncbi:MAG: N-formylglutamate deformylase, partial [Gammaproteobacteria bacterium]
MTSLPDWLELHRGDAPLIVSFPHTGTELPASEAAGFASPWLARRD